MIFRMIKVSGLHANRDSGRNGGLGYCGLFGIKRSKPNLKLILFFLLVSYLVSFGCINWITPIIELYHDLRQEETRYTDVTLQTRIALLNHPLTLKKKHLVPKSNPQPNNVGCSALIDGLGKGNKTWRHTSLEILCCDRSHFRTDVCYLRGDVRTHSQSSSVFLYSHENKSIREEKIRPYTRKWESSVMNTIDEITLKTLTHENRYEQLRNSCKVQHSVPALIFSTGGYTGNVYHEFNDGLLPLYITSQHLQGEVVFIILEYHEWWIMKYQDFVKQLSKYPIIDFRRDKRVHCFPEMIVGMQIHDELTVDSSLMKDGKSIRSFQSLLSKAYAPNRLPNRINETSTLPLHGIKPKLVIISRGKSRVMLNQKGITRLAQKIGFQVEVLNPKRTTAMAELFRALNSCDVMLGVHGAAMTHFLLMRPGSVFIQIVPLGTDWAAANYYGQPAIKLGLKYIEYKIVPEESSLYGRYKKNDPILADPDSINSKGWSETKRVYLDGQNVRPSLNRLRKFLASAYAYSVSHSHSGVDTRNLHTN